MSGKRCIDSKRRCLIVTNLPHHDDVWILTHESAETIGKSQADLWAHLCLIDAFHLILDRIFDSRNVYVWSINDVEHSVERGGLATAGRTSSKNHAGRNLERFVNI